MKPGKLIDLLSTFTKEDWRRFKRYADDKLNKGSSIRIFIKRMEGHCRANNKTAWSPQSIQITHFPDKTKRSVESIIHRTYRFALDFIALQSFEDDRLEKKLHLFRGLNRRGLFHQADKVVLDEINDLSDPGFYHVWKCGYKHRLLHEYYFSDNPVKYRSGAAVFEQLLDERRNHFRELDLYYEIEILNMEKIVRGQWSKLHQRIQGPSGDPNHSQYILLTQLRRMILEESKEDFRVLHDLVLSEESKIAGELNAVLLIYLNRFAVRLAHSGDVEFQNAWFDQMTFGIDHGILLNSGKITIQRFLNIVMVGCAFRRTAWVGQFVGTYAHLLDDDIRDDVIAIAKGNILLTENRISEVLDLLKTVNPINMVARIQVRILNLVAQFSYYDQEPDLMSAAIRNYDDFLRRNRQKMSAGIYQVNHYLSVFLKRLQRGELPGDVLRDLKTFEGVAKKAWLSQYLQEKIDAAQLLRDTYSKGD